DDVHSELTTAVVKRTKRVTITQIRAASMQRQIRWVVGEITSGADRRAVGVDPLKVLQPELRVETARVIIDECQVGEAHRALEPVRRCRAHSRCSAGRAA